MSSPLLDFVDHLEHARSSGAGYSARCPAHDDRRSSLSISEGDGGVVLVYCHAGCKLSEIVTAAGATMSDLFGEPRVVAEYPYRDENNVVRYVAERYQPKDFRVRLADGSRRWPRTSERILYNLPALGYARAHGLGVLYLEGEKDVNRAMDENYIATTTIGGANKPWQPQYTEALAGLKVTILADNDRAGLEWARKVRAELTDVCEVSVRVSAVRGCKDLSDLYNGGHTLADTIPMADTIGEVRLATSYEPMKVTWLWDQRIPHYALTLLEGDPGTLKSTIVAELIGCLTTGRALPGGSSGYRPYTVGLLADEDNWRATVVPKLRLAGADLRRVVHFVGIRSGDFTDPYSLDELATLRHDVRATGVDVLVIDPLAAYMGGSRVDTHRDASVRSLLGPLSQMAEQDDVTVIAIRHFTKGEGGKAIHKGGGSIAFVGQARSVLQTGLLPEQDEDQPAKFGLAVAKSNLAAPAPTLSYSGLVTPDEPVRIRWDGIPVPLTAQQLLDPPKPVERRQRTSARDYLRDLLRESDKPLAWKDVVEFGHQAGYPEHSLRDIRDDVAEKVPGTAGNRDVTWRLAGSRAHLSLVSQDTHAQVSGQVGHEGTESATEFTADAIEKRLAESPVAHLLAPGSPETTEAGGSESGPVAASADPDELLCTVCNRPALLVTEAGPRCREHNPLVWDE